MIKLPDLSKFARFADRWVGPVAVTLALAAAVATFLVTTGLTAIKPTHQVVAGLVLVNAIAILLLTEIVAIELGAPRRQQAGRRVSLRAIGLFSLLALAPAILVAGMSFATATRFIDYAIHSKRSLAEIAKESLSERAAAARSDSLALADDLNAAPMSLAQDREALGRLLQERASSRQVPMAVLLDRSGRIVGEASTADRELPSAQALQSIGDEEPTVALVGDYIAGVIKLRRNGDVYLYAARQLPPFVKWYEHDRAELMDIEDRRVSILFSLGLCYATIMLIFLLSAVWASIKWPTVRQPAA